MMNCIGDNSTTSHTVEDDPCCSDDSNSIGFSIIAVGFASNGFTPVFPHRFLCAVANSSNVEEPNGFQFSHFVPDHP